MKEKANEGQSTGTIWSKRRGPVSMLPLSHAVDGAGLLFEPFLPKRGVYKR